MYLDKEVESFISGLDGADLGPGDFGSVVTLLVLGSGSSLVVSSVLSGFSSFPRFSRFSVFSRLSSLSLFSWLSVFSGFSSVFSGLTLFSSFTTFSSGFVLSLLSGSPGDLLFRDVSGIDGGDFNFLLGDSAEDVDLEGDVSLDKSDLSVSDGDHGTFLDELGILALEEGVGRCGLITNHSSHHILGLVFSLDVLCADHLHVDVVAIATVLQIAHFDEHGFLKLCCLHRKY